VRSRTRLLAAGLSCAALLALAACQRQEPAAAPIAVVVALPIHPQQGPAG